MPSVCEADDGGAGMAKAPQRAGQCPAPTKGQKHFYVRRRGGCPHPPALEGAPFLGHGLPDAPFRLPAKRRRGGTLGRPPFPTAQLGPHRNKGAFKKRGVPSPRPLPGQRERKTRERQSAEPPAPLRLQLRLPNWHSRKNGVRGKRSYGHEVPVARVPGNPLGPFPSLGKDLAAAAAKSSTTSDKLYHCPLIRLA